VLCSVFSGSYELISMGMTEGKPMSHIQSMSGISSIKLLSSGPSGITEDAICDGTDSCCWANDSSLHSSTMRGVPSRGSVSVID
jgi:hypothetical protein